VPYFEHSIALKEANVFSTDQAHTSCKSIRLFLGFIQTNT